MGMRKPRHVPTLIVLLMVLVVHYVGCAIPGPSYYPIASRHALVAGSIIKDEDIELSEVDTYRSIIDGYRAPILDKEFITERSRVIGHKVLRDIPPKRLIHQEDISQ